MIQRRRVSPVSLAALAVAAVLLACFFARSVSSWKYWGDLDHNSPGTWMAMAADVRAGQLYRPLVSSEGYGGTRYAPLFPLIIAGFMSAGFPPVTSGFLAGIFAAAAAIAGLFALMRALDVPWMAALALALFLPAATSARTIVLGIKGDLLPAGLALCGLAAVVWFDRRSKSLAMLALAATAFALALTAKITSVWGFAAAIVWLVVGRQWRPAAMLAGFWIVAMLIAVGLIQWASGGRAIEIFRACASGGGGIVRFLQGPRLLAAALIHKDRTLLGLLILSLGLIAFTRQWRSLAAILLDVTLLGTLIIYGSPGTHLNHLVDLDAACLLVIGVIGARAKLPGQMAFAAASLMVLAASVGCLRQVGEIRRTDERGAMLAAVADAQTAGAGGDILAENPMLPMLAGQRPYLLDPFMFRVLQQHTPGYGTQMWHRLDQREFRAVILHDQPDDPAYESQEYDFGPQFMQRLRQNYVLFSQRGDNFVMTRRAP